MHCRAALVPALVAAALFAGVLSARAQDADELARARERFAQGIELMDAERYEDAVRCFRDVMQVRSSGQVKYNLAVALIHTGGLAEAAGLLDEVVDDRRMPARTRREARHLLRDVEPRVAHLTVRLQGDDDGTIVRLDDEELGLDRIATPIDVDPGRHAIVVRRGEETVANRDIRLEEGESNEVTLTLAPPHRAAVSGQGLGSLSGSSSDDPYALPRQPVVQAPAPTNVAEQWWFWVAMGAIAAVIATIVIAVATSP